MSKVNYDGYTFDSEWERDYYIYLTTKLKADKVIYHPEAIYGLMARKQYVPDFIYVKDNIISVVEVKGNYNPFANHFQDEMLHKEMKAKDRHWLEIYFSLKNNIKVHDTDILKYEKVKKLKQGWVDYDFKNPNTIANKRKEKISELEDELRELKDFKKDAERLFRYHFSKKKLTKKQNEWYTEHYAKLQREYGGTEQNERK